MAGYIGPAPVPQATQNREAFTATGGQTTFATSGYKPGYLDVYLNGVKLAAADYTATNGSDVVLASGAAASDILEIVAFQEFTVADQTFTGDITFTGASYDAVWDASDNALEFGDNAKATFGAGSDLQIYHDGTSNIFAGNIVIDGSDASASIASPAALNIKAGDANNEYSTLRLATSADGSLAMIGAKAITTGAYPNSVGQLELAVQNGAVTDTVLTVTSTGIDVTGTVTADGLTVDAQTSYFRSTGATAIQLEDTDGGFTAAKLNTENGGRDVRLSGAQDIILSNDTGTLARFDNGGDISFYEDTGTTAKFFWDASAESLGIGTSSPVLPLDVVANASANALSLRTRGSNDYSFLSFRSNDGTEDLGGSAIYRSAASTSNLLFYTANGGAAAERMRIDSSGNLLVGKTSASVAVEGAELRPTGQAILVADGTNPILMNRLTSDGDIAVFRKDGTTVGSIGTAYSGIGTYIGKGNAGIFLNGNGPVVQPYSVTSGAVSDGVVDIGAASARFKDLYLSGGVYLGGVGASNKLDDYEEGTWTPVMKDGSVGAVITLDYAYGFYTKIGRLVYVNGYVNRSDTTAYSSTLLLSNLPFTSGSNTGNLSMMGGAWADYASATDQTALIYMGQGASHIVFKEHNTSSYWTSNQFENGRPIYYSFQYWTNA